MNGISPYHQGSPAKGSPVVVGLIRWAAIVGIVISLFEA